MRRLRRRERKAPRGFTLLEALVALGVTAIVLGALATAVPTAFHASTMATERLERATVARTVVLHLERELSATLAEPFAVTAERLEFTGGPEPGERLAYTVEGGALVRRASPRFAPADPPATGVPLVRDVVEMRVEAFDGRDWVTPWRERTPPEAVRIRVRLSDGEIVTTIAAIPAARRRSS